MCVVFVCVCLCVKLHNCTAFFQSFIDKRVYISGQGGHGRRGRGRGSGRGQPVTVPDASDSEDDHDAGTAPQIRTAFDWDLFAHDPNFKADSWLPQYKRKTGVLVDTSNFEPVTYFKLFFPDSIFSLRATQSNLYLEQMKELPNPPANSRLRTAEQTSDKQQQAYVALQIAMGLCNKPVLADYWSG